MEGTGVQAPSHITCESCRQRWERYHYPDGRPIVHSPIGYIVIYMETDGQEVYHKTVRSYADLRATIATMEPGTLFTVHLCIFMDEVGGGRYTRIDGGVEVRHESRAAEGLYLAMLKANKEAA